MSFVADSRHCAQAVDTDGLEMETYMQEDLGEDMFAEDEAEGSDEKLGAHRSPVLPASSLEGRAELALGQLWLPCRRSSWSQSPAGGNQREHVRRQRGGGGEH